MIIKNAQVVSPQGISKQDVWFSDEGIVELVADEISRPGEEALDAEGLFLLPGCVDMHVHLRDPGATQKEDFLTGTAAALAGGVTTVADMPNNNPPIETVEGFEEKKLVAFTKAVCDFMLYFGASSKNLGEVVRLRQFSTQVAGIKLFMGPTTGVEREVDEKMLPEVFAAFPKLACVHAEDAGMVAELEQKYRSNLGAEATCAYHNKIRPPEAAAVAVEEAIAAAQKSGAHLHVCHASTAKEVELISQARGRLGVRVTCEVSPHHLFLTEEDAERTGGNSLKVNPPLRSRQDVDALWHGLREGKIDCIASDHAPHTPDEKQRGYWEAPAGVPGLETMLPLMLTAALDKKITLPRVVELLSANPAKILGLRYKGKIAKSADADLVLVDLRKSFRVRNANLYTKCGWNPFEGSTLRGTVERVFLRGREVFDGKHLVASPGTGKLVHATT